MSRSLTFTLYFTAIFLQAGAYGLTFMLPRLFASFGATEKAVGAMLLVTTVTTVITVYFSGHLLDIFGRLRTLVSRYRHPYTFMALSTQLACFWSWEAPCWGLVGASPIR